MSDIEEVNDMMNRSEAEQMAHYEKLEEMEAAASIEGESAPME